MKKMLMVTLTVMLIILATFALADTQPDVDPSPEDMQQKEAIELAKAVLIKNFEDVDELINKSTIEASFGYLLAEYEEPIWIVEFYDDHSYLGRFFVMISRQGDLLTYQAPSGQPYSPEDDEMTGVTFTTPGISDISEQEAVRIATSIIRESGYDKTQANKLTAKAYFLYCERYSNGWEPVWLIHFFQGDILQQKILLGYDGSYIDSVSSSYVFLKTIRPNIQYDAGGGMRFGELEFFFMTHEERADFSRKWIPIVEEYLKVTPYAPYPADDFYYATRCKYGIPEKDDLSQEDAFEVASKTIIEIGIATSQIELRCALFDVTDPGCPLWKLLISTGDNHSTYKLYRIIINATSHDVLDSYEVTNDISHLDYSF